MREFVALFLVVCFASCQHDTYQAGEVKKPAAHVAEPVKEPLEDEIAQDDSCVFNSDIKGLSLEMAAKSPELANHYWHEKQNEVVALLANGDTVRLSVGGCVHFNWEGTYITSRRVSLTDTAFWFPKARWLASQALQKTDQGFIQEAMRQNWLIPDSKAANTKNLWYEFSDAAPETDLVFNGISLEDRGHSRLISVSWYMN